jgi:hypothetical protein
VTDDADSVPTLAAAPAPAATPAPRPPLPRSVRRTLGAGALATLGLAALLASAMPTLRQARLLDAALRVCEQRREAAEDWLSREESVRAALLEEEPARRERAALFLLHDEEASVREHVSAVADGSGFELEELGFGPPRSGEAVDAVPVALRATGDPADLPALVEALWRQQRVMRLVGLELAEGEDGGRSGRSGSGRGDGVAATLRWDYAAPARHAPGDAEPPLRFAPPVAASQASLAAVSRWNTQRRDALAAAADALRALAPDLRELAQLEARHRVLVDEREAVLRWRQDGDAERRAIQRKLPALLHKLEISVSGRAVLRPGPGGGLQVLEGE